MSLSAYHKKRKFDKTPEPEGSEVPSTSSGKNNTGPLTFVIQKHVATRLHYDFRLELNGVLKSWAIPKGPSLNPDDKRMAVHVEDHPMDYANFEGIIPKGQYGGGTVMVWDKGVYHPLAFVDRKGAEKLLEEQYEKGDIKFVILGEKIKGEFALVRTHKKDADEQTWLLIKKHDEYATKKDVTLKDKSVLTGRSMDEIAKQAEKKDEVWFSTPRDLNLNNIPTGEMPKNLKPMLAQSRDEPFDSDDFVFEMKYDGYRTIAQIQDRDVVLYSRNGLNFNEKFSPIAKSLEKFPRDVVLDGEVVVVDKDGKPHFQWLQNYPEEKKGELVYFVFDMVWFDGHDLTSLPLLKRKELLKDVLPPLPGVVYSDHIDTNGSAMFDQVKQLGLEGIIAKHKESTYVLGNRSEKWLKIKTHKTQDVVICGFTRPNGGRKYFGSLIMGTYEDGVLSYVGHVGGGFDDKKLKSISSLLEPFIQKDCPFATTPVTNAPATWVKPRIWAEVSYSNITTEGQLRHPIFVKLREDSSVILSNAKDLSRMRDAHKVRDSSASPQNDNGKHFIPGDKPGIQEKDGWIPDQSKSTSHSVVAKVRNDNKEQVDSKENGARYFSKDPIDKTSSKVTIGKRSLTLSNLSKVFWPTEGYTKGELIDYYREIAPLLLPYLKDRPESLLRYPNGIEGKSFYQKDSALLDVDWIPTVSVHSDSNNKDIPYLLCQDEATLIYLINLGCIDLNPWSSRVGSLENPDYLLIDLDPHETNFSNIITTALTVREVLESLDIPSFPKTSGAKGMHIYIPLGAKYTYEQCRQLAELLCIQVHQKIPGITSLKRNPKERVGLIYLDYMQNIQGQTLASVYSVRAMPGATVSTPLLWDEVTKDLHPSRFTMKNVMKRIEKHGDLFKKVLGKGIEMEKVLKKMG